VRVADPLRRNVERIGIDMSNRPLAPHEQKPTLYRKTVKPGRGGFGVCLGIAVAGSELPTELIGRYRLERRLHRRGEREEYRFLFRDRRPCLPIWRDGQLQIVRWGNGRGQSRILPRIGWTWLASIREGRWRGIEAVTVEIPANYGLERRGVWFLIETGIQGLLVPDEHGWAVCYMVCEPASHYYNYVVVRIMWRSTSPPPTTRPTPTWNAT
jgi:hypothetical protein